MRPGFHQAAPQRSGKAIGLACASKPSRNWTCSLLLTFITRTRDLARRGHRGGSTWLIDSAVLPPWLRHGDSDHAGASGKLRMECDRERSIRQRRLPAGNRRTGRALQAPQPVQTYRIRLDQLKQGNASHGHTGEVEAIRCGAIEAMPSRRFPAPWRADKIPGG